MSATDGRLHAATSSERGGRECNSLYPGHFLEGRQIQAGCTCLENRIGTRRGRSVTDAFRQNLTPNGRKSYATCHPLPKPVALSQELQTKSHHSNPTDGPAERHFSSDATVRFETPTGTRIVAQTVLAYGP